MPRKRRRKKRRGGPRAPDLTVPQVLGWADEHHARTGAWPKRNSGPIPGSLGETWYKVDKALVNQGRRLPIKSSLAKLLEERRGVRNIGHLPPLTVAQVLEWADDHFNKTGDWPRKESGPVACAPGEKWANVDAAFSQGLRDLLPPAPPSLAELLAQHRGVVNLGRRPDLSKKQVLAWADAHYCRTGKWPTRDDGPIPESHGDTWLGVDSAMRQGGRHIHGERLSLPQFLERRRGVRNSAAPPDLTEDMILAWADAHRERIGRWPKAKSGPVWYVRGETWAAINKSLRLGQRDLPPPRGSLAELLVRRRGVRNAWHAPPLSEEQILIWADAHFARTGRWPTGHTPGAVPEAPEQTWPRLDRLLRKGRRELTPGSSLSKLLAGRRAASCGGQPARETASKNAD